MTAGATLRADVEALAALDRRSASPGELASARWCADRLRAAGAATVELAPYRYQHSFGPAHALHFAAAALGRLPAAAALAGFELDYSGRAQPLRRLLPAGEGANVIARIPADPSAQRRRKVVIVAHHDAAHTGLMWHPRLAEPGARPDGRPPFSLLPELAMAAIAVGPRRLRWPARAVLALATALSLQVARGATVPGASDNATGVAAAIALVERLAADRPPGLEVVCLLPGSEESGMGGMAAWIAAEGAALDPATTLVLGLDTLGAGDPVVLSAEGPLWRVRYDPADLALADAGAARAGRPAPRRFRLGGWTDPVLARIAGLPAISLLSLRGNVFSDYHLPTDTPDRVDWDSVGACLEIAEGTVRAWADGIDSRPAGFPLP
ncbi:MAG: M28 family peptidase [Solirubrobacterales bacterium]|nr:M28 family peptidase [Solirubrobacterales bacterium]